MNNHMKTEAEKFYSASPADRAAISILGVCRSTPWHDISLSDAKTEHWSVSVSVAEAIYEQIVRDRDDLDACEREAQRVYHILRSVASHMSELSFDFGGEVSDATHGRRNDESILPPSVTKAIRDRVRAEKGGHR